MLNKLCQNFLQPHNPWLDSVHQSQHIIVEISLQIRHLVKLIQNLLWISIFFQFYYHANLTTRRLITCICDVGQFFIQNQLTNLLDKTFLTHTVRHLGNHNIKAAILALFDISYRTNRHRTLTSRISLFHRCTTINFGTRWEIWPLHVFHQIFQTCFGIFNQSHRRIHYFTEVMWRNIGRHTDRDTHLTIQKNIWQSSWQNYWLFLCTIKVITKIYGFLLDVCQKLSPYLIHSSLGIT